jgi:hypothetical protein
VEVLVGEECEHTIREGRRVRSDAERLAVAVKEKGPPWPSRDPRIATRFGTHPIELRTVAGGVGGGGCRRIMRRAGIVGSPE